MDSEKQSLRFYEMLFDRATEGLIIVDADGRIELANPRAGELFGYTNEELLDLTVEDLIPGHLRDKHKGHRSAYAKSPHSRSMGEGFDLIGVRKDGSSFPLAVSLSHFQDNGDLKVMALVMDVTQKKEQEAQIKMLNVQLEKRVKDRTKELNESQRLYKLVSRNFPEGTINVFDRNFNYVFAEGAEMYKSGITSKQLVGKNYLERLPEEVRDVIKEKLELVLAGESQKFELHFLDQYYIINTVGLANEAGEIDRILLVEQNITERKKAEEKTKEALGKEKELNELKSRFVSMASHEFRTPLSTVLSSLSLLEKYDEAKVEEKKPKHYKRIRSSVRHLTNLLNDFLSLEKVETGKVSLSFAPVEISELFEEIVDQQNQMTKSGQEIHLTIDGSGEIMSDQNMLQIISTNLLSNAIKYSGEDKDIFFRATLSEDNLYIEVQDQGIGIPAEDQANMFSRFFRAKNAINIEGTGLGLNIVQRYLDLLNGSITFESEPEVGTTFKVTIPISTQ